MIRTGIGYDIHRLVRGRRLFLGGVEVPAETGLLGHSDADVLLHAICDALLGAAALGDIGQHFPDTDPRFAGASSLVFLQKTAELLRERGYRIVNVDSTVILQHPKIARHIPAMREKIAAGMEIPIDCISVKATTNEELGSLGRAEGCSAFAIATIES
jgi:2-C-methyl-D-erythritol 2,4-cyclodiphosphate synthase